MAKDSVSQADVLNVWNEKAGRKDYFELREIEGTDGSQSTQLISGGGSLVVQVNGHGEEALRVLRDRAGDALIEDGTNPKEVVGPDNNEKFYTKQGNLAFPTQPEAIQGQAETVYVDNRNSDNKADQVTGDPKNAQVPDSANGNTTVVGDEGAKSNSDADASKSTHGRTGVGSTLGRTNG